MPDADFRAFRITRLKLDGECRRNEIKELNINISHGLHERMEVEKLANLLMDIIWKAIENSIPEFHSRE